MIQPYSAKVCTSAIEFNARLSKIIEFNARLSKIIATRLKQVNAQHHGTLKHAAGYLYLHGFLDSTQLVARGKESKKARRRFIEQQRDEAITRLQEAGIIPVLPTWFSFAWFVLRWVIIPFVDALLEDYSQPEKVVHDV